MANINIIRLALDRVANNVAAAADSCQGVQSSLLSDDTSSLHFSLNLIEGLALSLRDLCVGKDNGEGADECKDQVDAGDAHCIDRRQEQLPDAVVEHPVHRQRQRHSPPCSKHGKVLVLMRAVCFHP